MTFSNGAWTDNSITFSAAISTIKNNSNINNFSSKSGISNFNVRHDNGNNNMNNNDFTIIISGEENIPLFNKGKYI